MKNYLLKTGFFLALVLGIQDRLCSIDSIPEETISNPLLYQKPIIIDKKTFPYGSISMTPGVGVSDRSRTGSKGRALDLELGVLLLYFDMPLKVPILSIGYNFFHFLNPEKETSFYVSYGLGTAYFFPYIPLRAGIQWKHGFFDIGAKTFVFFPAPILPSPEIRGGITFTF